MEKFFVTDESVKGYRGLKGKCLYSLLTSLCRVKSDYIQYTYHVSGNQDERSKADESQVERVFAYELYHQLRENNFIKFNTDIVINAELPKQLIDYTQNEHLYYPDMVVHFGQNKPKGNLIICEIKRKEYMDAKPYEMLGDIKKLRMYLDSSTKAKPYLNDWEPYELGIMIVIVKKEECNDDEYSVNMIKRHFDTTINKIPEEIKKRIICAVYNGYKLKYDNLYNMTK